MTVGQYLKTLFVMCYALIGGMVMFSIISIVVSNSNGKHGFITEEQERLIFYVVVAVFAMGGITSSFALFKGRLQAAKQKAGLAAKLQDYKAAIIMRYALLEGPGLFSIVVYFLTGDIRVLIATAAIIALMVFIKPTREKLIADLELSSTEAMMMNDDNSIIE